MQITTIGLDLAKSVFQVHGVDAEARSRFGANCVVHRYVSSSQGLRHA